MLKLKDNINLKELENYGAIYVIETKEYYFKINDSEYLEIPAELLKPKKIEKIQTFVNENYIGWTSDEKAIVADIIKLEDKINEIIDEIDRQKS